MIIQHNISALNAHRQLGGNNNMVSKNLEKLSSGYKINRAGDDAAGLAISEKMRAQITGLTRAQSNAQDGISLVQTAEGALTEVHSMLNRMVDLATQSSNGTMQPDDRQKIQDEMDALTSEIDRVSESTNFNGINLLDGSLGGGAAALTGGAKFTDTKATLGKVTMGTFTVQGTGAALQKGDTIDYTLNWVDKDGKAQETKLTFTADSATELVGNSGEKHTVTTTKITADEFAKAIKSELEKVEGFKDAFTVTNTTGVLAFESKILGANGGRVTGAVVAASRTDTAPTGGVTTTLAAGLDATQKLDLSGVKAAVTAESAADMMKKVFTVDGKKFLAIGSTVTTAQMALLDKDINLVTMGDADDAIAATDNAAIAASINRAFGNTGDDAEFTVAAAANAAAGITANDLLYSSQAKGLTLQIGDTADDFNKVTVKVANMGAEGLGIGKINVGLQGVSSEAIATIKSAIETVSINRSAMGALQNRLEHTINNLGVTTENMTAAESRVRDVDMAKEMMTFTKNNVLTQAAQAMLAQANQQPQGVLQLLR